MSNIELLILTIIVVLLVARLKSVLGKPPHPPKMPKTIRVISDKDGKILQMQLLDALAEEGKKKSLSLEEKMKPRLTSLYQMIVKSFASGDLEELKKKVSPKVFGLFSNAIQKREEKKQKMEFSLISEPKAKILTPLSEKTTSITVEFITEQVNILKNKKGKVIEGDSLKIAEIQDIWTFVKKGSNWILQETKGKELHA
ncbi:MAG: Tim44 domain-containing protein [Alphaproteobacteria bacterium]|nr:Tim44/TimA family putative adaptor protein [Alphaproteobacteria bacterium]NCB49162.1 Tim44 domain-containing protein [Alphaproteobacteria bacterium]